MANPESTNVTCYNSTFRHTLDEKRRVQIPAKWRPSSPEIEFTVIEWPNHVAGTCLRVLPPEQLKRLMDQIEAIPGGDPKKPALKRKIGGDSAQVRVDSAGRICLPDEKVTAAGIEKDVVLIGLLDRFEIWAAERFEAVRHADAFMAAEAFKLME
jgi:MraZ protein